MRIALLAPIDNSFYSRIMSLLIAREEGLELSCIVVRKVWTWRRMKGEIQRDGTRLLRKAYRKLILGKSAYSKDDDTIVAMAKSIGLPEGDLYQLAEQLNVPILRVDDHNDPEAEAALTQSAPDLIVFTGGGIIRKNIINVPDIGIINCHCGILPPYRGMDVVEWPLLDETVFRAYTSRLDRPLEPFPLGVTTHLMDTGIDTGPLLKSFYLPIEKGDTFESLRVRIEPLMINAVMATLRGMRDGQIEPKAQKKVDGKQYFVMHPRIKQAARKRLSVLEKEYWYETKK